LPPIGRNSERAVRARAGRKATPSLDEVAAQARERGVLGWVRSGEGGELRVHAEGRSEDVDALLAELGEAVEVEEVKPEGHEQFGIRGVDAGAFVVREDGGRFELGLEVAGAMRRWALPRGPSMDPAGKRMAFALADGPVEDADAAGAWDRGGYEQGGRMPWPEAIERGHAVFVLNGERLRGGFALQRTRDGDKPQWLLIKRRDDEARPGSDVVAEAAAG
jgi:DNA ligase D-like protein (predicted 3'-phosphoesterase)